MFNSIDITTEPIDADDLLLTFSVLGNIIGRDLVSVETFMNPDAMVKHLKQLFNEGSRNAE